MKREAWRLGLSLACLGLSLATAPTAQRVKLNAPLERVVAGRVLAERVAADRSFLVYAADPRADGRVRLVRAPLAGTGEALDLGVELRIDPGSPAVPPFELDPTGARVVFLDRGDDDQHELFSVPSDGSAPAVRLNAPLVPEGEVLSFRITPDGARVVYFADQEVDGEYELFAVPLAGGAVVKVNAPLPSGAGVFDFELGPDSRTVLYRANPSAPTAIDLFRGSVDGRQPALRLNVAHPPGREVREYELTRSGLVVYTADSRRRGRNELFAVPVLGGVPRVLNQDLIAAGVWEFVLTPDGKRAVYSAPVDGTDGRELYSVPLTAGEPPRRLDPSLPGTNAQDLRVDARGRRVAFRLRVAAPGLPQLWSAPIDGSAPAVRLDLDERADLEPEASFVLSPAGERALYLEHSAASASLYSAPLDGSGAPVRLATLGASDAFAGFDASGRRAVYGLTSVRVDGRGGPIFLGGDELASASLAASRVEASTVLYRVHTSVASSYSRTELYRVPVDGSEPPTRVNPPFPFGPTVDDVIAFATGGERVAYATESGALFGVSRDGSTSAVLLSGPASLGSVPPGFVVSPDGARVAFSQGGRFFLAATDGTGPAEAIADAAEPVRATPDGRYLLYRVFTPGGRFLEAVPFDGSVPGVRLGESFSGEVLVTPGSRVVFGDAALFSAPIDGSMPALELGVRLQPNVAPRLSPDGRFVVCAGAKPDDSILHLLSVAADGSTEPTSIESLADAELVEFAIDSASDSVVYILNRDFVLSLWKAPITGGAAPVPLLPAFPSVALEFVALSADGSEALLPFDVEVTGFQERGATFLFDVLAVRTDGSQHSRRLNAARAGPGSVFHDRHGVQHLDLRLFLGPRDAVFLEGDELVAAALDGSAQHHVLATDAAGTVRAARFTPDGASAVFVLPVSDGSALYEAATDGDRSLQLLSGAPVAGGHIGAPPVRFHGPDFLVAADGGFALYIGDLDDDDVHELFSTALGFRPRASRP